MLPKSVSAGWFTLSEEAKGAIFLHSYSYVRDYPKNIQFSNIYL